MRALAILLLGVNFVVLGWGLYDAQYQRGVTNTERKSVAGSLVLLNELSAAEHPKSPRVLDPAHVPSVVVEASPPSAVQVSAITEADSCFVVSTKDGLLKPEELRRLLASTGVVVLSAEQREIEQYRYWVLLPAFPSRREAEPTMARLRASGVEDFYFVPTGERKNALSLGVFSTREAALRRVTEIMPLNLKVQIEEVAFQAPQLVIEVDRNAAKADWRTKIPSKVILKPVPNCPAR